MKERWEKLSVWLRENEVDAAFINSTHNVFYLSNFSCHPYERLLGLFVFPDADPFLVCPKMEVERARSAGWTHTIIRYDDVQNPWEQISEELRKREVNHNATVAIEKEQLSYMRVEQLLAVLPDARFVSADEPVNQFRLIKEADEIQRLREAAIMADQAIEVGISSLREGCTEMEVVAQIELEMKRKGISQMAFSTMVLFGEKTAQPHGHPGTRMLKHGELVLFDLGVIVEGYCSDITRTVAFGAVNEKQREIYETVLKAQLDAINLAQPGVRMGDLDRAARTVIAEAGYGEYFFHRLGHGLGIDVHEFPSINESNNSLLQTGMVFTVEPGIYVPEIGGVRIEDDVLVTETGCETLTRFPKELQIVG